MIKWTPKTEEDFASIRDHIARNFGADLATDIILKLIDYVESTLTSNPLAGVLMERNPFFSKLVFDGNSIYYCENPIDKNLYIVYVRPIGTNVSESRVNKNEIT